MKDGLSINGYPIFLAASSPSSKLLAYVALRVCIPTSSIASLNFHLFSATSIASAEAPSNLTLFFLKTPFALNSIERFKAV